MSIEEITMDTLRTNACYERDHARQSVVASIEVLRLQPGMNVLDVGCGPGAHLGLFAERVAPDGHVTGLDINGERLAVAAELNAALIEGNRVSLREGDLHALPFGDGMFDVVWTSAVLHHEQQPVEVVQEMARTVRVGGRVVVLDSDGGGTFPLVPWPPELELRLRQAALRAEHERYGGELPYYFTGYLGRRVPEILRSAGLGDVQIHAFSDVDRAPLDSHTEEHLCHWFADSFARRLRNYLAPADLEQLTAFFTPGTEQYLPSRPDFFCTRTYYLATGMRTS